LSCTAAARMSLPAHPGSNDAIRVRLTDQSI
jgi:hypothetical protein